LKHKTANEKQNNKKKTKKKSKNNPTYILDKSRRFGSLCLTRFNLSWKNLFLEPDGSATSLIPFFAMRFKLILGSTLDEFVGGFLEILEIFLAGEGNFEPDLVVAIYRRREDNMWEEQLTELMEDNRDNDIDERLKNRGLGLWTG
jgi:hypothetical protein